MIKGGLIDIIKMLSNKINKKVPTNKKIKVSFHPSGNYPKFCFYLVSSVKLKYWQVSISTSLDYLFPRTSNIYRNICNPLFYNEYIQGTSIQGYP